jgi:hypothetical protein
MALALATCCCAALSASGRPDDEKPAARALEAAPAEEVAKKVNFDKEYVLLFRWTGGATDKLTFEVTGEKNGRDVVFRFTPGKDKGKKTHTRLFAVAESVPYRLVEAGNTGRVKEPKKITTAKGLADLLPAPKEK